VLNGAQATMERRRDDSKEWWQLELGVRAKEGERELKSEGERCGVLRGWSSPFIWAGRVLGKWQQAVTGGG
jgi:hypothetical protein